MGKKIINNPKNKLFRSCCSGYAFNVNRNDRWKKRKFSSESLAAILKKVFVIIPRLLGPLTTESQAKITLKSCLIELGFVIK